MSNSIRGFVDIDILDKPRKLRYTMNALCKIEDLVGRPLTQLGSDLTMTELRAFLWCGLIHEDEELTLEQVGACIDMDNIEEVTVIAMKAFGKAVKKNGGKMAKAINARSGIGTKS